MISRGAIVTDGREVAGRGLDWLSKLRNAIVTVTFFVGLGVAAFVWGRRHGTVIGPLVAYGSALAVGAIVGALSYRYISRNRDVPLGYRLISAEYELSFKDDPRHQSHRIILECEARRSNVTLIEFKFRWTGQGSIRTIRTDDPKHSILKNSKLINDGWIFMYVHLAKPLMAGERTTIRMTQKLFDAGGDFQPHLTKTLNDYSKSITLRVKFPSARLPPSDAISAVVRHPNHGDRRVIKRLDYDYDSAAGTATLVQKHPARDRKYCLEWDWNYP